MCYKNFENVKKTISSKKFFDFEFDVFGFGKFVYEFETTQKNP